MQAMRPWDGLLQEVNANVYLHSHISLHLSTLQAMTHEKPAKQARSRATAERLLSAAIRVIAEHGMEGATIPRIAKMAKVAPASVYRRYVDKDALIRAALLHLLRQSNKNNREMLKKHLSGKSLESTAKQIIQSLLDQYRQYPLLMRALTRYLETTQDRDFIDQAHLLIAANLDLIVELLMAHRTEINRPDPRHALRFAVMNAASTVETFALGVNSLWRAFPEFTAESFARNVTAGFIAYVRA
jgi:AcrR family transcriptional regulator